MAGLGDLVGGFQQGALFREQMTRSGEERADRRRKSEGSRRALEVEMGDAYTPEIQGLYDPYEWNLGQMFRGVFSGKRRRERVNERALESQGMPTSDQAIDFNYDRMQMADGGSVREAAEALRRRNIAAFEAGQRPGMASRAAGAARGAVNRVGRAAAPIALGATAIDTARTPTEDYRRRFGMEVQSGEEPSFLGDVGVRALGAASDLGSALTLGYADRFYRDKQDTDAAIPVDEGSDVAKAISAKVPPEESTPAGPPAGGGAATPRAEPSPFVGPPEPEQQAAQLGNVDIMPDDMPTMGTQDWVKYRQEMVPALMMQGATAQEAHQQVTTMQHQGFMRYGQQAAMMLQAGNQQGAARALKAAYQYFPNGADVKFGFQNGQLVSLGLNEETGEPQGAPQVITPEFLAAQMTNFENPERFLAWTKDWRDESFREREYQEVTRPNVQSQMEYRQRSGDIAQQQADTAGLRAITAASEAGGAGGPSEADIARSEASFREAVEMLGLEDPRAANELASVMAQIRVRVPVAQLPDNTIVSDIMRAYAEGNLDEVKAQLGLR